MKKIILTMLLGIILICSLSACGEEPVLTDAKGNMIQYSISEIESSGFYVYNKNSETFTPLMNGASGYDGLTTEESVAGRFLWFGVDDTDLEALIPTVDNKDTFLVIIQGSSSGMPENYVLEKYKKKGYTVGAHFSLGDTGSQMYIDVSDTCETSMAGKELSGLSGDLLPVHKVNKSEKLPLDNIDLEIGMLLGLEKNKKYQFGIFDGTIYNDIELIADTAVYKSERLIMIDTPIKITENDFFYINLPENLENGYYYINDAGLFKYKGKTSAPKVNKETETQAPSQEEASAESVQETEAEADAASESTSTETETVTNEDGSTTVYIQDEE